MTARAALVLLTALVLALLSPAEARAFPFMIRHGYTGCGECHVDPSGGGALTAYGRGQSAILLSSTWGEPHEPGKGKDFLWGAVPLPEQLALQADLRSLVIPRPGDVRVVGMQNDLRGAVTLGKVVAYASLGIVSEGAGKARVGTKTDDVSDVGAVSREHWVGYKPTDEILVRAGSINAPYGLRTDNHITFARAATRTDVNDDQPFGVGAYWAPGKVRGELLLGIGDPQVSGDDPITEPWERSYHATVAWSLDSKLDVGASSLMGRSAFDLDTEEERTRQAHALHARWSPVRPLVLFGEAGLLRDNVAGNGTGGSYGWLLADVEPVQGLHVEGTGEWCASLGQGRVGRAGGALRWFVAPHFDVRMDLFYGTLKCTPEDARMMGLLQGHVYL
jgi:hypothetical protein